MGDVVELNPEHGVSSNFRLPDWPHPRKVTFSIEQARAIDRDIRHLDAVMERARDMATISTIVSTICGAETAAQRMACAKAALAIGKWLSTGRFEPLRS
jgi:hypothetical protein